jgi:hypothetical protein
MPPGNPGLPSPTTVAPCCSISLNPFACLGLTGAVGELLASKQLISPVILFRVTKSSRIRSPLGRTTVIWVATSRTSLLSSASIAFSHALPAARFTFSCATRFALSFPAGGDPSVASSKVDRSNSCLLAGARSGRNAPTTPCPSAGMAVPTTPCPYASPNPSVTGRPSTMFLVALSPTARAAALRTFGTRVA